MFAKFRQKDLFVLEYKDFQQIKEQMLRNGYLKLINV